MTLHFGVKLVINGNQLWCSHWHQRGFAIFVANWVTTRVKITFTRGQFWPPGIIIACVCLCVSMCQPQACLNLNSSPVKAKITKFRPKVQNTLVVILIVLGLIDLDLQLTSQNFIMHVLSTGVNKQPIEQIHNSHDYHSLPRHSPNCFIQDLNPLHILIYLDRFTVPTVSQSQPLACISRQLRIFQCLTLLLLGLCYQRDSCTDHVDLHFTSPLGRWEKQCLNGTDSNTIDWKLNDCVNASDCK